MVWFLGFSATGILGVFDWFDVRSSLFLLVGDAPVEDLLNFVVGTAIRNDLASIMYRYSNQFYIDSQWWSCHLYRDGVQRSVYFSEAKRKS